MKPLTIGQIARRAGIGVETVRIYEARGYSRARPRVAGYRQYAEQAVAPLQSIRRAKERGFTFKESGELLALRLDLCPGVVGAAGPVKILQEPLLRFQAFLFSSRRNSVDKPARSPQNRGAALGGQLLPGFESPSVCQDRTEGLFFCAQTSDALTGNQ